MERDELDAEVSLLIDAMEGDYGDRHEILMRVQALLHQMQAVGMPLPEDLVRMAEALEAEFVAERKDSSSDD